MLVGNGIVSDKGFSDDEEMAVAFLKDQGLGRILAGHPWIYAKDVLKFEKVPVDGGEIVVRRQDGAYLGTGLFNSKSRIPIRLFSRSKEHFDEPFVRRKLKEAQSMRETWCGEKKLPGAYRVVWSEADFLPGLIVDRYGDALVIQTLTLAMDQRKSLIVDALREIFSPSIIVERNDVGSREFEGLPQVKQVLLGSVGRMAVTLGRVRMEIDLIEGQKTGSYLDQVGSHVAVGDLARGKRVLDCFTYHGGFALHAAQTGAASVEGWDISEAAVEVCKRNAELNGLSGIQWKAVNVFDALHAANKAGNAFDLVVLDPPSFTRSRAKLQDALRGYKEIHLRALKLLSSKGLLATFCCSHHVDADTFRAVILDAAFDARKTLRWHASYFQSWDHPVIPAIPETEYLKGFLFEVV